eukprot:GSMAST32.ASY1.ANO1.1110.1 assembled CDS
MDGLDNLSKEELIDLVQQYRIITATVHSSISVNNKTAKVKCKKKKKIRRPFDFSQYRQRHIALKVWYNGEDYLGLASQSDTDNTVESKLFDALQKTCLIENRLSSVYSRCGRTDKGVSASGQVIALNLRSKLKRVKVETEIVRLIPSSSLESKLNMHKKEHDYAMLLNNVLPLEIRVLELNEKNESQTLQPFDARFSCRSRTYRYFFPKRSLNLHQMQEAASYFVGQHDFRNFCKMDVVNVHNFVREILTLKILEEEEMKIFVFEICGRGFLWHQVRCMVAVLFLVGRGQENPSMYIFQNALVNLDTTWHQTGLFFCMIVVLITLILITQLVHVHCHQLGKLLKSNGVDIL